MAVVTQIKLGASGTTYDINDKRISTTAVSTATHLLTTNSGVTSIAPITTADLASALGGVTYEKTLDIIATSISITNSDNTGSVYFEVQGAAGNRGQIIYGVIGGNNAREVYWTSLSENELEGKNYFVHKSVSGSSTTAYINFGGTGNINYKVKVRGLKSAVTVEGSNLGYSDLQSYDFGVNCGIPNFYNNYSDLSSLASALGGMKENQINNETDLNTLKTTGLYSWINMASKPQNAPSNVAGGFCVVLSGSAFYRQIVFDGYYGDRGIYVRTTHSENNWTSWVRTDNYGTSSLAELASALGGVTGSYTDPLDAPNGLTYVEGISPSSVPSDVNTDGWTLKSANSVAGGRGWCIWISINRDYFLYKKLFNGTWDSSWKKIEMVSL